MLNPKNEDAYGLREIYKKDIRTYKTAGPHIRNLLFFLCNLHICNSMPTYDTCPCPHQNGSSQEGLRPAGA